MFAINLCLLSWIRERRRTHPDDEVRCPQCRYAFVLEEKESYLYVLMKRAVSFADSAIPFVSMLSAGSGIAVAATAYGCLAIRLFVGSAAAQRMLAGPWPWHYWIDIPMVPFMLVASQLPVMANFSTWLPTLVALPVTSYPTPIRNTMMLYRYAGITAEPRRYPPSPIMTVRRSC